MVSTRDTRIAAVRHFNRIYTRRIGVLREGLLHSPYSLTEARVLFETAQRPHLTASDLGRELGLDTGYLSRTLAGLERQGLLERVLDDGDRRQRRIQLTAAGKEAFALLDQRSGEEIGELLDEQSEENRRRLLRAMAAIESILDKGLKFAEPLYLRAHEPGDMGWVTHRHGALYAQEYGWSVQFEALVATIVSDFLTTFDSARERCWIAEMGGEIVGSVFVVRGGEGIARLRLLLVEPKARGHGLGAKLVDESIRFARRAGYKKLMLWTNSVLVEARNIYRKAGFVMVQEEQHHSFGHDLVGEIWELEL